MGMKSSPETKQEIWLERLVERYGIERPRGEIYVIKDRCKGCGFCIEFCPEQVLKASEEFNVHGYHYPILVEEEPLKVCVNCGFCTYVCPDFAIFSRPKEMK